jgi:predicted DNA-binding protein (MmcQ/YjbR family)
MEIDWLREFCLSLAHTTEQIQWGDHLVFKVGGKMYAVAALEPVGNYISLKSSPEDFAALTERPGIIPAPYLARAKWIAIEQEESVSRSELKQLLAEAHRLVLAALPKRARAALSQPARKRVRKPRALAKRKRGTAR